jgi:hypothetical protein
MNDRCEAFMHIIRCLLFMAALVGGGPADAKKPAPPEQKHHRSADDKKAPDKQQKPLRYAPPVNDDPHNRGMLNPTD